MGWPAHPLLVGVEGVTIITNVIIFTIIIIVVVVVIIITIFKN